MTSESSDHIHVLAVDDDRQLLDALKRLLSSRGFEAEITTEPVEALSVVRERGHELDLVVLDVGMPQMSGLELLSKIKDVAPHLPVVMLTADASAQTAVQALSRGAYNYLVKPPSDPDAVAAVLRNAAEQGRLERRARELERRVAQLEGFETLVGSSPAMREVYGIIDRVAPLDINVVIYGESGTGKELVARAIHERSKRKRGAFVGLNCAAMPDDLVDSELFGHAKGAFTGAVEAREGAFQRADKGTLLLDEIGDIPPAVQLRLLRTLQEGEVSPVGSDRSRAVDVRIIAATLVDLDQAVDSGSFRPDLYYRLNVVMVNIPPLRARGDDVELLASHFVTKHAHRMERHPVPRLAPDALRALHDYDWPGNVRELENAIQRALALTDGDELRREALPERIAESTGRGESSSAEPALADSFSGLLDLPFSDARKRIQERFERAYISHRLEETGGNISEAARRSRLDRSNFRRILQRTGAGRPDSESS